MNISERDFNFRMEDKDIYDKFYNKNGLINCPYCNKTFKKLACHLRKHNITIREYKIKNGIPIEFPLCSKEISARQAELNLNECHIKGRLKGVEESRKVHLGRDLLSKIKKFSYLKKETREKNIIALSKWKKENPEKYKNSVIKGGRIGINALKKYYRRKNNGL